LKHVGTLARWHVGTLHVARCDVLASFGLVGEFLPDFVEVLSVIVYFAVTDLPLKIYIDLHQLHRPCQVALLLVEQAQVPASTARLNQIGSIIERRQERMNPRRSM